MTPYQITKLPAILDFLSFHKHHAETTRNDSELLKIKDKDNEIIWTYTTSDFLESKGMGEFLEVTDKSMKAQRRWQHCWLPRKVKYKTSINQ